MCKPFTLIINVLCDQLTEVPVAIMDPLSWIDSWLDQNEGLVHKAVELFQRAVFLLEKDISLEIGTKNHFVATHKAKIGEPDHVCLLID